MNVLVTGGAGFIGSHLVDALLERGHDVTVFDNLEPQVHGQDTAHDGSNVPPYLSREARLVRGDIRDFDAVKACLLDHNIEVVFHEAAMVGVGQSMYDIRRYVDVNTMGAATLLEAMLDPGIKVQKILVASSMSIYGEGAYTCATHGTVYPRLRTEAQFARGEWEMTCPICQAPVAAQPTNEDKPLAPTSIYATTKRDHEEMVLEWGEAYRVPAVALRYFNVYGPRQALNNPYTGLVAIFAGRLLQGLPPLVFEDGQQSRDFIHVSDIVQANILAMESPKANGGTFNVGTGRTTSVLQAADLLGRALGRADLKAQVLGKYRAGDIRHCYSDISRIQDALGYAPKVALEDGVRAMIPQLQESVVATQSSEGALSELEKRGLAR